jgi:hypothetical protein
LKRSVFTPHWHGLSPKSPSSQHKNTIMAKIYVTCSRNIPRSLTHRKKTCTHHYATHHSYCKHATAICSSELDPTSNEMKVQHRKSSKKGKTIHVASSGGPYSYETSKFPHVLDNRLTDGGKVVCLTRRPCFTSKADSWYSFLLEVESAQGSCTIEGNR